MDHVAWQKYSTKNVKIRLNTGLFTPIITILKSGVSHFEKRTADDFIQHVLFKMYTVLLILDVESRRSDKSYYFLLIPKIQPSKTQFF